MSNEKKFQKKLTQEEIQKEIDKMENYFKQIPEDLKLEAGIHFILEIILWCGDSFMESVGLLTEVAFRFRESYTEAMKEEKE